MSNEKPAGWAHSLEYGMGDVGRVLSTVARAFGLEPQELTEKTRTTNVLIARQTAIHLASKLTRYSSVELGRVFARDHTTILSQRRSFARRMQADPRLRVLVSELESELAASSL